MEMNYLHAFLTEQLRTTAILPVGPGLGWQGREKTMDSFCVTNITGNSRTISASCIELFWECSFFLTCKMGKILKSMALDRS